MLNQIIRKIVKKAKEMYEDIDLNRLIGTFIMAIAIIHPLTG